MRLDPWGSARRATGAASPVSYDLTMKPRSELLIGRSALWLFAGVGIATIVLLAIFNPFTVGAEDAVILHQFSRNLAETGVISYIPGGERAEGATDFLWMVYLAAAMKAHLSPGLASAIADVLLVVPMAWDCAPRGRQANRRAPDLDDHRPSGFLPAVPGFAQRLQRHPVWVGHRTDVVLCSFGQGLIGRTGGAGALSIAP